MHDELHDTENPRSFWKDICKLGMARERKSCIPMEIIDHNNQIKTKTCDVLHQWKSEYEHMFNDKNNEAFDTEHLENIVSSVQNPEEIFSLS